MITTNSQLKRYTKTVALAAQWARNNWDRILAEKDLQGHYKGPYLWAAVGDMQMAALHRALFAERFLQEDGDFRSTPESKGFFEFPCTVDNQYLYSNGWIVSGMQKIGAFEIAQKGLDFLLRLQDSSGGFYASYDPKKGKADNRLLDSSSTSSAGLACLFCGRLAEARRAGDFILHLLELQPERELPLFHLETENCTPLMMTKLLRQISVEFTTV
jgi:hypothetical protein